MEENKGIICPVCGEYTFKEEGDYDICPVCRWENELEPAGLVNGCSAEEAREKWKKGIAYK